MLSYIDSDPCDRIVRVVTPRRRLFSRVRESTGAVDTLRRVSYARHLLRVTTLFARPRRRGEKFADTTPTPRARAVTSTGPEPEKYADILFCLFPGLSANHGPTYPHAGAPKNRRTDRDEASRKTSGLKPMESRYFSSKAVKNSFRGFHQGGGVRRRRKVRFERQLKFLCNWKSTLYS